MSRDSNKRRDKKEDDLTLLQQIREANVAAGEQFLEYLVLQRRSSVRKPSQRSIDPFPEFMYLRSDYGRLQNCTCSLLCHMLRNCYVFSLMTPFRNYGEPKVRQIYLVILSILISVHPNQRLRILPAPRRRLFYHILRLQRRTPNISKYG